MWIVTWLGRQDPDPRTRRLSSRCATLTSAKEMARRIAETGGERVRVRRIDGDAIGVISGGRRPVRIDDRGNCIHELKAQWCSWCRQSPSIGR